MTETTQRRVTMRLVQNTYTFTFPTLRRAAPGRQPLWLLAEGRDFGRQVVVVEVCQRGDWGTYVSPDGDVFRALCVDMEDVPCPVNG